jgi:hypothetical protein
MDATLLRAAQAAAGGSVTPAAIALIRTRTNGACQRFG